MIPEPRVARVFGLFAKVFQYPLESPVPAIEELSGHMGAFNKEAAELLAKFGGFLREASLGGLQEAFTATFDLEVVCYPYVGFQLFGESFKRGSFMVKLKEEYDKFAFSAGNELPDHVSVLLRFLALLSEKREEGLADMLVGEALVPALEKMAGGFKSDGNPYGAVILSLLSAVTGKPPVTKHEPGAGNGDSGDDQPAVKAIQERRN